MRRQMLLSGLLTAVVHAMPQGPGTYPQPGIPPAPYGGNATTPPPYDPYPTTTDEYGLPYPEETGYDTTIDEPYPDETTTEEEPYPYETSTEEEYPYPYETSTDEGLPYPYETTTDDYYSLPYETTTEEPYPYETSTTGYEAYPTEEPTVIEYHTTIFEINFPELCSTGIRPAHYTVTDYCPSECKPDTYGEDYVPPGFWVTEAHCDSCGPTPVVATLTTPIPSWTSTYTTEYDEFCSTGVKKHEYTVTETCYGEPTPHKEDYLPPGFSTTVDYCDTCGPEPLTKTLTVPCEKCKPTLPPWHPSYPDYPGHPGKQDTPPSYPPTKPEAPPAYPPTEPETPPAYPPTTPETPPYPQKPEECYGKPPSDTCPGPVVPYPPAYPSGPLGGGPGKENYPNKPGTPPYTPEPFPGAAAMPSVSALCAVIAGMATGLFAAFL